MGFPVRRGHIDRPALNKALDVLQQRGVIGIFPEGGIWQAGRMSPQRGVAWLSYRSSAPVLPIGFGGTAGALGEASRLRRPVLTMNVGTPLPAARLPTGEPLKQYLERYVAAVMEAVNAAIPAEERRPRVEVTDERFELQTTLWDQDGNETSVPQDLAIQHEAALSRLLHNPGIHKVFEENLQMNVNALQRIQEENSGQVIAHAAARVLRYLNEENEYFLTYRFGAREAERTKLGLEELVALARWAAEAGRGLRIVPIRRYFSPDKARDRAD